MALKIRLARRGSKKRPFYSIVVAENTAPRDGGFIEKIGSYNPFLETDHLSRVVINKERAQYWLSVGAKPTDRVELFFGRAELMPMPAQANTPKKSLPKKKAQERMKAEQEAAAASA